VRLLPARLGAHQLRPYLLGCATGIVVGLGLLVVWLRVPGLAGGGSGAEPPAADSRRAAGAALLRESRRNAIVQAVEQTRRSVVTIRAVGVGRRWAPLQDLFSWPARREESVPTQWVGSGFLIDQQGHIVTTEHVVRGARQLVVSLGDGTSARAEVVGKSPRFDLALLRVDVDDPRSLTPAILGDSDDLMVGEWAIAIGSPFGDRLDDPTPSVSVGVISAVQRGLAPPADHQGPWPYFDLLQTDAAVNRGNSGGPLVNSNGEVIGVNMAQLNTAPGSANAGVNLSIPINTVRWVAEELREYGEVRTPWVGWLLEDVDPAVRAQLNLPEEEGVLVVGVVEPGSPAERAGVGVGDYVLSINDQEAYSRARAERILFDARVGGAPIRVGLLKRRGGHHAIVMLDVAENPSTRAARLTRTNRPAS
jgi:serine protease Do